MAIAGNDASFLRAGTTRQPATRRRKADHTCDRAGQDRTTTTTRRGAPGRVVGSATTEGDQRAEHLEGLDEVASRQRSPASCGRRLPRRPPGHSRLRSSTSDDKIEARRRLDVPAVDNIEARRRFGVRRRHRHDEPLPVRRDVVCGNPGCRASVEIPSKRSAGRPNRDSALRADGNREDAPPLPVEEFSAVRRPDRLGRRHQWKPWCAPPPGTAGRRPETGPCRSTPTRAPGHPARTSAGRP